VVPISPRAATSLKISSGSGPKVGRLLREQDIRRVRFSRPGLTTKVVARPLRQLGEGIGPTNRHARFDPERGYHPPAVGTVAGLISRYSGLDSRTVDESTGT